MSDRLPVDVEELRASLDTEGFAIFRGMVSTDRVDRFAGALMAEYGEAEKFQGGGSFSGHLNCFPGEHSRCFYDELEQSGLVDAVRTIRADKPSAVRATLNFNLPGSVAQHYHMDGLFTDDFLICNVAVVDTDLANGAIDVLPGTHREFLPFWKYALERTYRRSTGLPMERGDVLVRRSTLWHRGMPNATSTPRPLMSLTFGESSAPEGDPFLVNDGRILFYPNWFKTSRLGQIRERTFVAAPVSYSTYRFVKSLHGKRGYSSY